MLRLILHDFIYAGISESQMEALDASFAYSKYRHFTHNPRGHFLRDPGFNGYEWHAECVDESTATICSNSDSDVYKFRTDYGWFQEWKVFSVTKWHKIWNKAATSRLINQAISFYKFVNCLRIILRHKNSSY